MTRRLVLVTLIAGLVAALGVAPASSATLKSWRARVTFVSDGDTFDVRDSAGRTYTVRMLGINTPEFHLKAGGAYFEECHGRQAYLKLKSLIDGKTVVLKAENFNSTGTQSRKLRFVHLLNGTDVNAIMAKGGYAVAYPNNVEPSRNAKYIKLTREAKAAKRVIWKTASCKYGPRQSTPLRVRLRWDANGGDETNLNGEYVRIENGSSTALSLKNWHLRENSQHRYDFGDAASIPAKGSVTVHTGKGTAWSSGKHKHYYWGKSSSIFDNERMNMVESGRHGGYLLGDGAYLYDPHWDMRAYMEYPCLGTCQDKQAGKVSARVYWEPGLQRPANDEIVYLTNISDGPVYLGGYLLESWPWNYEIARGTTLAKGETLKIHSGSGRNSRLVQYQGQPNTIFQADDYISVRSMEGRYLITKRW
jgi:micrococcal nuclease